MKKAEIKMSQSGELLEVTGELCFQTVPGLRELGSKLLSKFRPATVDLSAVIRADSAALALLAALSRQAKKNGDNIRFTNVPLQLMEIARLSNLDKLLLLELKEIIDIQT